MAGRIRFTPLGLQSSFGFGDRIGLATPGHVAAMRRAGEGIAPIFAQQSIREMARTGRQPDQVLEDVVGAGFGLGGDGRMGADADHLKTTEDIDRMRIACVMDERLPHRMIPGSNPVLGRLIAYFTMFTFDPSGFVDPKADTYDPETLRSRFRAVEPELPWLADYAGRSITLPSGTTVRLDEDALTRGAVKYGRALNHAAALGEHLRRSPGPPDQLRWRGPEHLRRSTGPAFEVELSIDETDQPTTLAEHFLIADRCRAVGLELVSLAPRFVGDFEKGIDYKGDVAALEASLRDHAALAEALGPYKLSLHSGSDKLSIYPALARSTKGRYHVKTAGTSYLEALRVVALADEGLFRRVVAFARERYDTDKATYHVSATLDAVPPPDDLSGRDLIRTYLGVWDEVPAGAGFTEPGRQILHCTFGSTLTDPELGSSIRDVLKSHANLYTEVLADHFARHLAALRAGWSL